MVILGLQKGSFILSIICFFSFIVIGFSQDLSKDADAKLTKLDPTVPSLFPDNTIHTPAKGFKNSKTIIKHKNIGKELTASNKFGDFKMNFYTRVQTRFDGSFLADDGLSSFQKELRFRRVRLKFDGYAFSQKLGYKIELDVLKGEILDAVLKWQVSENFSIWGGQTKVMGNRERVISSRNLQFIDRSLLNKRYNLDRDLGIQFHHHFKIGKWLIIEKAGVFIGEGKNYRDAAENINSKGLSYTGRIEFLPFGKFNAKGDYFNVDLEREVTPRLSVGISYDFNDEAILSGGQLGDVLNETADLKTLMIDAMFKYRGFSFMGEYANKTSDHLPISNNTDDLTFKTGNGLNLQSGYLFKNNWEIAGRYGFVNPEKKSLHNSQEEYSLAISKYIVGHKIKVQSDFTLITEETIEDRFAFKLQLEFDF